MTSRRMIFCVAFLAVGAAPVPAPDDAYQALSAMSGHWQSVTASGRTQTVDNQCARTGLFYVCEQTVGGKPAALVVFLPQGRDEERKRIFHTQTLTAAGDRAGPWRELIVEGDRWTYGDLEKTRNGKRRLHTVITYSGPDYMHVEVQASTDGERWNTVSSENLHRAP